MVLVGHIEERGISWVIVEKGCFGDGRGVFDGNEDSASCGDRWYLIGDHWVGQIEIA